MTDDNSDNSMYNESNDSIVPNYAKSQTNWVKFFLEKRSDSANNWWNGNKE